jgi:hypothetical protein
MRAVYLRFADQAAADAAMSTYEPLARDDVGTVFDDGVPESGYHVNLVVEDGPLPDAVQPFEVFPTTPMRRFAGF